MRLTSLILGVCLLIPSVTEAQERNILEVGTSLTTFRSGSTRTTIHIPTQDIHTPIYFSLFLSQYMFIEPDINLDIRSNQDRTSLEISTHVGYLLAPNRTQTPYFLGYFDLFDQRDSSGSDTGLGLGLGGGYRWEIGPTLVIRAEAAYYISDFYQGYPFQARVRVGFRLRR